MGGRILELAKKHLIIKTRAILVILGIMFFYRLAGGLFDFSIVRFLMSRLGDDQYVLIGTFFSIAAFITLLIDIPLGLLQGKIRPRHMMLTSAALLMFSVLIFLLSTLTVWLGFLAVLLYQLSLEIYFVTTCTYILRLSNKDNVTQNLAQGDVADNVGIILGIVFGGLIFFIDSTLDWNYYSAILLLFFLSALLFIYVYEFVDHKNYTSLEKYILEQKFAQKNLETVRNVTSEFLTEEAKLQQEEIKETSEEEKGKIDWVALAKESYHKMYEVFVFLYKVFSFQIKAPTLFWVMLILMFTIFWNQCLYVFEPIYVTSLFGKEDSLITNNIPQYFYEAMVLVTAMIVPTFIFEVPLGKMSDLLGKEKIIIGSSILAGLIAFVSSLYGTALSFFLLYLTLGILYIAVYPAATGLMNEKYTLAKREGKTEEQNAEKDENAEGESAAIIMVVMNVGEILSGIVGGIMLDVFSFKMVFTLLALALVLVGVGSAAFLWYFKALGTETEKASE